ncbi:asparaginase-domain-containing protein [Neoconidiobolus thromboides FSU 785]|nr:asparaginase-domain-containing protein [Neoconidiobolus thromboides FSU 785]
MSEYTEVLEKYDINPNDTFEDMNLHNESIFENQVVEFQRNAVEIDDMLMPDVSRILVIYTGGTIGMTHNRDNGYEPKANYLSETLASQSRFHDPEAQGPMSPTSSESKGASLLTPKNKLRWLLTPKSLYGKRIRYAIKEYDPLLDSCNMTMADWIKIATDIEVNYKKYDAFIVLHGTDTMAYTASALSFMLEDLGKTVIITGSQVPISEVRNDAIENLLGALTVAGHFVIPEVCLYFGNKLFRGNRCSKVSAIDFEAFDSPNLRPLVHIGVNIEVNWNQVLKPKAIGRFKVHKAMNPNVAALRLFPGITEATVKAFLSQSIQGVVLETFGAGNAPNRADILNALKEASARGTVIVNCTQCRKGSVADLYATAKGLKDAGVVPGIDMTPECALTKLSYLLAKDLSANKVRELMRKNLRGELTGELFIDNLEIFDEKDDSLECGSDLIFIAKKLSELQLNDTMNSNEKVKVINPGNKFEKTIFPVLLCNAAGVNDVECLKYLLKSRPNSFNVNCVDYEGRTPIHIASSLGHYDIAKFLLLNGAALHLLDRSGHTPLYYAAYHGHSNIIQLLLNDGAHLNSAELRKSKAYFIDAASKGLSTKAGYFLEAGLDVNCYNSDLRTALHMAICNQKLSTVETLLSFSDIRGDIKDRNGKTSIDEAKDALELDPSPLTKEIYQLVCNKFIN